MEEMVNVTEVMDEAVEAVENAEVSPVIGIAMKVVKIVAIVGATLVVERIVPKVTDGFKKLGSKIKSKKETAEDNLKESVED